MDALVFDLQKNDGRLVFRRCSIKKTMGIHRAKTLRKHTMLGISVSTSVSHTIRLAQKVCGVELLVHFCELLRRYSKEKAASLGWLFWPFLIVVRRRKLVLGANAKSPPRWLALSGYLQFSLAGKTCYAFDCNYLM